MFLILSIKLLNVNLEKILKSEQFLTDKDNLLNNFAASSWNVPDSIGMAKDIPELEVASWRQTWVFELRELRLSCF